MASTYRGLPAQRRLLDAIAAGESPDYNVVYGGGRFNDFSDHPRQAIPIQSGPNAGKTSSAAGRYQFLAPTWDQTAKELGLPDFSPASQDAAAWYLAEKTYATKTGRDLMADIEQGRTQDIAPALKDVWTSIPGGIEPNNATANFAGLIGGQQAPPVSPSGEPGPPMGLLPIAPQVAPEGQGGGLLSGMGKMPMGGGGLLPQAKPEDFMEITPSPFPQRRRPMDQRQMLAMRGRMG